MQVLSGFKLLLAQVTDRGVLRALVESVK